MKVTFIYPRFEKFLKDLPGLDKGVSEYFLGNFTTPPSLGIPILAALTPPDVEVELIDDNSGDTLDYDAATDLVAINCFTPQATRAFEIADRYRAHGKKVIMGGFFPSLMADECLLHADSVNTGEGEPTWPQILEDVRRGELKKKYVGGCSLPPAEIPVPKREIFYSRKSYDWDEDLVQVARGCSYTCLMCAIPEHMGHRIRLRPIDKVVEEIRQLKYENVYLADDMLFFPQRVIREYAEALFRALAPLGRKYFVASTLALNIEPAFLDLAARAGVLNFYCTMNVDPVSIRALRGEKKERQILVDLVKGLNDRDIRFFGSCAIGRDWDDADTADRILDLYAEADIHTAEFFVYTPYPGTQLWGRLESQGRILDRNWSHYNGAHVVSRPLNMTPDQLQGQFLKIWNEFFKRQKGQYTAHLEPATWNNDKRVVGKPLQRQGIRGQAVVTGIGVLSPIGNDPETMTDALRSGQHGLKPIVQCDTSFFRTNLGGEVRDFDLKTELTDEELGDLDDLYLRYAVAAARRAFRHAGIQWDKNKPRGDVAMVVGSCNGGLHSAEAEYLWKHGKTAKPFDERMNLQAQFFGFGKAMAGMLGITGETWIVTTACSSSTVAIGLAAMLVNKGYYSTVLVGGVDAMCVANMAGFDALKATSTSRIAPFSLPYGLNIGEGACFWVMEEVEKALLRNARCLGRVAGHATTSDAYHPTSPDPRGNGAYRTLRDALADSQLPLSDIGCINAHGSGTEANDKAESKGITKFIGDVPIPAVSTKSFFGHCMGAAGILEATAQLLGMNEDFIPPTLNFSTPRPGCTLDCVPNVVRKKSYPAFISANYAFGGNNAAVVITKWNHTIAPRKNQDERVVLVGMGAVTAAGLGVRQTLDSLINNKTCLAPYLPQGNTKARLVGRVEEFGPAAIDKRLDFSSLNPISRYAVAASKLALDEALLKVSNDSAEQIGVVMGGCNGPSEMGHMDRVFGTDSYQADVGSFSNITMNSTAGWVSFTLLLKGINATLAPGPHAGIQSIAYAFNALSERRVKAIVAAAADEVYVQTYNNYDRMGFLFSGEEESDYRIRPGEDKRKVLGDGAAALVLETASTALARGVPILAEVLGYAMNIDAGPFLQPCLGSDGLKKTVESALNRAGLSPDDIGLLVWAPQGNRQDLKVLEACETIWGSRFAGIPIVTTTFNTGFIESASILVSVAAAIESLKNGLSLWPQRTGMANLDNRKLKEMPKYILALASTDLGYNFCVVLRHGWVA